MFKCFKHGNDIILDSKPDDVTETHVSVTSGIYIKAFPFLIQITNISKCLKGPEKYEKKHWYKFSDRGKAFKDKSNIHLILKHNKQKIKIWYNSRNYKTNNNIVKQKKKKS
jgi:hypothetical protein